MTVRESDAVVINEILHRANNLTLDHHESVSHFVATFFMLFAQAVSTGRIVHAASAALHALEIGERGACVFTGEY
jgi:hypothetical protein